MVASDIAPLDDSAEPLGRNRDFRIFFVSQGVSALGDAVSSTALPLLILALTGSGLAMGVVSALQMLPDFAFGMVAGALADRRNRKRMMFIADLGRAALTGLIPLSVLLGGPTMAIIVLVAAPMSIFRALFRAGYIASIPGLVGRPQLARANAILETVFSIGFILGPAIAGFLAAAIGPGPTLAIDAASFALSSIGLVLIRRPLQAPVDRPPTRIVDDIREGIAFVLHEPVLRSAILLFGLYSLIAGPIGIVAAWLVTRDLGFSPAIFGLVLTAYGVGTIIGSLVATRMGRRTSVAIVLLGGVLSVGLMLIGLALSRSVPTLLVFSLGAGFGETILAVAYVTLRTAYSPDHLLGRVGSTARVFALGLMPPGTLAVGVLIDATNGATTFLILGIALIALALAFVPVRALRTARLSGA